MDNWKDELKEENVDVDAAINRFSGKEDRYIKYLKLFYKDNSWNNLLSNIENTDTKAAFESCHTLKGISANLGFNDIFNHLFEACEILRNGEMTGVMELVNDVKGNYERITDIIQRDLM